MISLILLAAGSGRRMAGEVDDKILAPLNGLPALCYSLRAFQASALIDTYTIVYRDDAQKTALLEAVLQTNIRIDQILWVQGGSERQDSVEKALATQPEDCEYVFIHDAARPLVSVESIQALDKAVRRDHAAVLAHAVTDTIKRIPQTDQLETIILEDLQRSRLWAMETPQAFNYAKIRQAYKHVRANDLKITDDTAAAASIGLKTTIVPNTQPNPKLTTSADLAYIKHLLKEHPV